MQSSFHHYCKPSNAISAFGYLFVTSVYDDGKMDNKMHAPHFSSWS
jgi:hypothetical protein